MLITTDEGIGRVSVEMSNNCFMLASVHTKTSATMYEGQKGSVLVSELDARVEPTWA